MLKVWLSLYTGVNTLVGVSVGFWYKCVCFFASIGTGCLWYSCTIWRTKTVANIWSRKYQFPHLFHVWKKYTVHDDLCKKFYTDITFKYISLSFYSRPVKIKCIFVSHRSKFKIQQLYTWLFTSLLPASPLPLYSRGYFIIIFFSLVQSSLL